MPHPHDRTDALRAPSNSLTHLPARIPESLIAIGREGELQLVFSCERTGTLAGSVASLPLDSIPAICEPCGVWVSLDASHKR